MYTKFIKALKHHLHGIPENELFTTIYTSDNSTGGTPRMRPNGREFDYDKLCEEIDNFAAEFKRKNEHD